jgi:large subunit ribosomal protein L30
MAAATEAPAKVPAAKATAAKVPAAKVAGTKVARTKRPASAAEGTVQIKQVRSGIGTKPKHRGTLRALGLGKIGRTVVLPDRPEIRGMVARVTHLVEVRTDNEGVAK